MSNEAEAVLNENLYGVHKEMIKKHHAFEDCILQAMQSYADQQLEKRLAEVTDEIMRKQARNVMEEYREPCQTPVYRVHRRATEWILNLLKNK